MKDGAMRGCGEDKNDWCWMVSKTWDLAILDTLASVADRVECDGRVEANGNC